MQRILIVEDSPTQAVQLRAILEDADLDVVVAPDAESALGQLGRTSVDLVISDIVMPGMSGYELCGAIKATHRTLPVMLLSTLNEPMDIIRGLECGADNFLTKPYKAEQLLARVQTILQNRSLRATSAVLGIEIMFLGRRFTVTSEKEQILDLLISTFEDTVQANRELQRHRTELAAAKIKLEEYARALEGRVRVSEEKYAFLLERANVGIVIADLEGRVLEANREASRLCGVTIEEMVGKRLDAFERHAEPFPAFWQARLAEGNWEIPQVTLPRPDGTESIVSVRSARMRVGDDELVQKVWYDITDRVRLEEQLRHAQRMEAMGQLTGGMAHDFNNLLGVIIGNLDAIGARNLAPIREFVENALEAAERGANLIKQLLAFARRQPLNPEGISIPERLPMTIRLLQSTLGSRYTVESVIDPETLPIRADLTQLESAILNLAVNARDAMADGGRLVIECGNTEVDETYAAETPGVNPGYYVTISVSDNGSGMPPEVAAKVFDPFFSTKGSKGTGLGLSQVFGFAKQSGGNVKIYSEVGIGTTVRLYLPATAESVDSFAHIPVGEQLESYRGSETILLVEDNDAMREIAEAQLRALGYDVETADGATAALALLRSDRRIDLLLTDIVMPGGLDGRQLALRAREVRPALKVLFTSGFTEAAVATSIQNEFGGAMLSKPYRHTDLAKRVRTMLGGA